MSGSSSGASSALARRDSSSARPCRSRSRASSPPRWPGRDARPRARASRAWEPYWPSSSATAARVASDSCSLASATSTRRRASARSRSSVEASKVSRSSVCAAVGELLGGLVDRSLDLDQAGLARGAAGGEVGAEQVALAGHRGDVGCVGDQRPGGRQVVDHGDLEQQPGQRGPQLGGALHHVDGVRRAGGQTRPARCRPPPRRRAGARRGRGRRPSGARSRRPRRRRHGRRPRRRRCPRAAATAVS